MVRLQSTPNATPNAIPSKASKPTNRMLATILRSVCEGYGNLDQSFFEDDEFYDHLIHQARGVVHDLVRLQRLDDLKRLMIAFTPEERNKILWTTRGGCLPEELPIMYEAAMIPHMAHLEGYLPSDPELRESRAVEVLRYLMSMCDSTADPGVSVHVNYADEVEAKYGYDYLFTETLFNLSNRKPAPRGTVLSAGDLEAVNLIRILRRGEYVGINHVYPEGLEYDEDDFPVEGRDDRMEWTSAMYHGALTRMLPLIRAMDDCILENTIQESTEFQLRPPFYDRYAEDIAMYARQMELDGSVDPPVTHMGVRRAIDIALVQKHFLQREHGMVRIANLQQFIAEAPQWWDKAIYTCHLYGWVKHTDHSDIYAMFHIERIVKYALVFPPAELVKVD